MAETATAPATASRWALAAGVLALGVLVLVLVAGGGAPQKAPLGIPDPGPITGWGLPAARLLADLAGVAVVGLLLAAGLLLPSSADVLTRVGYAATRVAVGVAVAWAAVVAVELWLSVSDILGLKPGGALDPTILHSFVVQVPQGRVLTLQALVALLVAAVARSAVHSRRVTLACALALVGVALPTLTGHAAASGDHELAVASLVVHVICATAWTGGLLALAWVAVRTPSTTQDSGDLALALARFSTLAGVCWAGVGISGVVNAGIRLGSFGAIFGTRYGLLVVTKAVLLVVLGSFGWWHRSHTVGQLRTEARSARPLFLRVAGVELLVMAATFGVAVGLSRTPTPVENVLPSTGAAAVLGFDLPPAPSLHGLLLGWLPDGFAITFLVVAGGLYAAGLRVLRRRGDHWPVGRTLAWYAGLLVFAWATIGGLGLYSHIMFSWHMVAHMMLSMVAPVGLVLGAPLTLALRALPGRRTPKELGLRQLLQHVLDSRPIRLVTHPLVAAGLFVGSLYAIYLTPLFGVLMREHLGHVAMELHFVAVGSLFFWVLIGVDPVPRRLHPFARMGLLLVVMPFHAFFAIAVMNSRTVFAHTYFASLHRPYSSDLLADQRLGGGITWALSELPIVLVMAALFVQWIRSDQRDARRIDKSADGELARYNERLAALAAHDARASAPATQSTPSAIRKDPTS